MDSQKNDKQTQTIIAKEGSTVKNVIQAIVHLPAWAWIAGIAILSISLITASAIFNILPLQGLLPTPTAFTPASEGQSLIIVADFEDRSGGKYEGLDPAQYVYEQLLAQAQKDNLDIRIERLRQAVDDNNVKSIGDAYNATLVVWGWYDALTITPRMERIKTLEGKPSDYEGTRISIAEPEKIEFSIVTDLPNQTSYLVMFTFGIDKYTNEQYDEALIYFNNAIQNATQFNSVNPSESFLFRGLIYEEKGNLDQAIADYSKATEINPNYAAAYNNRAIVYGNKGNYNQAILDFSKAIKLDPTNPRYYSNRGNVYSNSDEYEQALADYNKAIELNPDSPDAADAYNNRGVLLSNSGDDDLALADYSKAIELRPTGANSAVFYFNRGGIHKSRSNYDLALTDFNKAIEFGQTLDWIDYFYKTRGVTYYEKGDYERAIEDFNNAININNNYSAAYLLRGNAYSNSGKYEQALADYTKVIELTPDDIDAYSNRCLVYYFLEKFGNALEDCNKAIFLNPNDDYTLDNRAYVYLALGRESDAINDFEHILEISTDEELRKRTEEILAELAGK